MIIWRCRECKRDVARNAHLAKGLHTIVGNHEKEWIILTCENDHTTTITPIHPKWEEIKAAVSQISISKPVIETRGTGEA